MKTKEVIGIVANLIALAGILITGELVTIFGGTVFLVVANIMVKFYNMYRMEPRQREKHREEGGSGIWC